MDLPEFVVPFLHNHRPENTLYSRIPHVHISTTPLLIQCARERGWYVVSKTSSGLTKMFQFTDNSGSKCLSTVPIRLDGGFLSRKNFLTKVS